MRPAAYDFLAAVAYGSGMNPGEIRATISRLKKTIRDLRRTARPLMTQARVAPDHAERALDHEVLPQRTGGGRSRNFRNTVPAAGSIELFQIPDDFYRHIEG